MAVAAAVLLSGALAGGNGSRASAASVTVRLPAPVAAVRITEAKVPGRPIVLIDPGHGGQDPGATAVSGDVSEKQLTLEFARALRDKLAKDGRVRVALTRDDDRYLSLEDRAALARQIGASLFLSIHMDSAPNPMARGASIYSLSEVASDAEAARLAQNANGTSVLASLQDGSVRAILSDLALRGQMTASADFAERVVRSAEGRMSLRPQPHRFADFHVLRNSGVPAILFEAGYISNADDEAMLLSPQARARIIDALSQSIEADVASRTADRS